MPTVEDEGFHAASADIDLDDLLRNLGLVTGIVTTSGNGPAVEFNEDWFNDPLASLRNMPGDEDRRNALAALFGDVLPPPVDNPVLDASGKPGIKKWYPLPRPGQSTKSEAAGTEEGGDPSPPESSGVFLVIDEGDAALVAGLGLLAPITLTNATVTLFAEFPLVSLPSPSGDPVLFIKDPKTYPVMVGAAVVDPRAAIEYEGSNYDTLHAQVGFDALSPLDSEVLIFLRAGTGDYLAVPLHFPTITEIVNIVLGVDAVSSWLDAPIVSSNTTSPSVGKILDAFGLLDKLGGDYTLGTLDVVEHLTLEKLLESALKLLAGFRIVEIHDDPKQGLFVVGQADEETGATRYGLRLAVQDIVLSGDETKSGGEDNGQGTDEPAPPAAKNSLSLQLGKGFEPKPAPPDGGDNENGSTAVVLAEGGDGGEGGGEGGDGNWTESGKPLGVSLLLLEETTPGDLSFAVGVELVSVGIDYSNDGPAGLVNAKGFQFSGVEPRIYLAVGGEFGLGAAVRVDDLEMPLDSTMGPNSEKSNPVANNLIESKSSADPGTKSTPPARTKFSASAAYDAKHEFVATVYDAERKPTDKPVWFAVEQAFGPVDLQKVGVGWVNDSKQLSFYVDGRVKLSALSIELQALSITFPLYDMADTTLGLKGLELSYQAGSIDISGGFVEVDGDDGPEYYGEVLIKAAGFTISALGAYGLTDGHPSLFIFALIDIPLGGPPFFFVDGVAAGFGFNRDLRIPTLDEIPSYPLVQGAVAGPSASNPFNGKTSPTDALEVLAADVKPSYGADWLAAGVRFSSFEMIQSFALLTVKFGTDFEIDLIGLSDAAVPPGASDPIANVQLALLVTFAPDRGFIGASAKLTDESYVFSKSCHLTGGFAFYLWFANDPVTKAPAGQFVVTLGGYNSYFSKPSYYPDEPRLGLNWQLSSALSIKGGIYFALTPAAIMAGGYLDAVFQGGIVNAWFKAHADFLLGWKPFFYEISIGIDLGCRIRLPLVFCTVTITLDLGVDLNLWGPPFGGKIKVHLLFFSFTIPFGSSSPALQPITWAEFETSFLPASDSATSHETPELLSADSDAPTLPQKVSGIRPTQGLLKDLSGDTSNDLDWLLDPMHMTLEVFSLVPLKSLELVTAKGTAKKCVVDSGSGPEFGVGPMAVTNEHFRSTQTVTIDRLNEGQPDADYNFAEHVKCSPTIRSAPMATWDVETAFNQQLKVLNSNPLMIDNTPQGSAFTAIEKPHDKTNTPLPIAVATLQGTLDPKEGHFDWSAPAIPSSNPFAHEQGQSMTVLTDTIGDPAGPATRSDIITSLLARNAAVSPSVDVAGLAGHAAEVLLAPPVLTPLGGRTMTSADAS